MPKARNVARASDGRAIITLDSRRRVSFANIGNPTHKIYSVVTEPDGTIIMSPCIVISITKENN